MQRSWLVQNKWKRVFDGHKTLAASIIKARIKRLSTRLKYQRSVLAPDSTCIQRSS